MRFTHYCRKVVMGLLGGLLLVAGWSGLSYADHFTAEVVSLTKHNLSANPNIAFGSTLAGSSEVCVYCHTPHGAGYSGGLATGIPPLWNRKLNITDTYTTYDASPGSPHFDAGASLGGQVKGVSLACLSCHDGTIAFDALINAQGSGSYQLANATAGVGPGVSLDAIFGGFSGEAVDGNNSFEEGVRNSGTTGQPFGGSLFSNDTLATGAGGAEPFPNLGIDLRDDHPISFEIPTTDPQFTEMIAGAVVDPNSNILYLKRDNPDVAGTGLLPDDKRDRIRAYPSTASVLADATATGAYIECASCHNPHTPRTVFLRLPSNVDNTGDFNEAGVGLPTGGGLGAGAVSAPASLGASATFWSHAPNQASAICVSCHQK